MIYGCLCILQINDEWAVIYNDDILDLLLKICDINVYGYLKSMILEGVVI